MLDDPIPALKRQLADAILEVAAQTNMHVAASVLGIDTARMSDLRRGRIERFSVERLIRLLAMVDRRVELTIAVVGRTEVPWFGVLRARYAARHGARPCMEPQGGGPVRDVLAGSGKNTRGQPIRL